MLSKIQDIAKNINTQIQNQDFVFEDLAENELKKFDFDIPMEDFEKEIADWILKSSLPKQVNVYNTFGQPPITLYNNEYFAIDIYFWLHHDTSIHDHSFSGAFKVLYGRSLHESFKITCKKQYASDVMETDIIRSKIDLFKPGKIQKITKGPNFNHRLIHLDQPTVTLCIRTVNDTKDRQWHHFQNGLSIQKLTNSEDALKKIYFYEYLCHKQAIGAKDFLTKLISSFSISTAMNIYEDLASGSLGLSSDLIQNYYDHLIEIYGNTAWFKKYISFYEELNESYIEFKSDTPGTRLLEFAYNTKLDSKEIKTLMKKIYPDGVPKDYLTLF